MRGAPRRTIFDRHISRGDCNRAQKTHDREAKKIPEHVTSRNLISQISTAT